MIIQNPYLDEAMPHLDDRRARLALVQQYAWAIPTEEAIQLCVSLSPIVEVGAGTGYWASLIAAAGGAIHAYDIAPPTIRSNRYKHSNLYHPVMPVEWLRWDRTYRSALMLCWPPYEDSMAYSALRAFRGNRLIYIGEGKWGCTGNDAFHEELEANWTHTISVDLPQWCGLNDRLQVWERS